MAQNRLRDSHHSPRYRRYLHSKKWRAISQLCLESTGKRCTICGATATQSHHTSYHILGKERGYIGIHLFPVCFRCHQQILHQDELWKDAEWRRKVEQFLQQRWLLLKKN